MDLLDAELLNLYLWLFEEQFWQRKESQYSCLNTSGTIIGRTSYKMSTTFLVQIYCNQIGNTRVINRYIREIFPLWRQSWRITGVGLSLCLSICQNSVTVPGLVPIASRLRFSILYDRKKIIFDLKSHRTWRYSGNCTVVVDTFVSTPEDHSFLVYVAFHHLEDNTLEILGKSMDDAWCWWTG